MGLAGQSSNESMQNIYGIAAVLFVLVLLAGILMISGSMNSNVAQRTKFFGMMRCIGASSQQIIRFVRLEALNWCKIAIPLGLILGTAITWAICALLRYGIGGEFSAIPVFALSPIGLISGAVVGLVTVLLAAQAPAKRAAKVSPEAAVSGSSESAPTVRHSARPILNKIEWTLGVHHATASKKNWFLMTASFSLSIILFLCFAVILDFAHELVPSLRSWQPDITLNGYANALLLEPDLLAKIQELPHVKTAYGTAYLAMITLFHIINSISMSVTARIRQYGTMRAVGMDGSQLTRMIIAEALTYAISGLAAGCGIGLVLSRSLHIMLLTRYFGIAWSLPVPFLCIIIVFDFTAAFLAVYAPSRRIRDMSITDTINELECCLLFQYPARLYFDSKIL